MEKDWSNWKERNDYPKIGPESQYQAHLINDAILRLFNYELLPTSKTNSIHLKIVLHNPSKTNSVQEVFVKVSHIIGMCFCPIWLSSAQYGSYDQWKQIAAN